MVKCFVVGCSTGYKSAKENDAKVFKPPKEERQFILWGKNLERSDRKFSRKDHVCSRHFKEEFIIKNSVNGGAPLTRWKLRDDAIPTLVLGKYRFKNNSCMIHELILNYAGYKDGVAPNKKYRKKTTSPLSNNGCHNQPEEKLDARTTSDVKSTEVTLAGESSLEHKTPTTGVENLVETQHEENISSDTYVETQHEENITSVETQHEENITSDTSEGKHTEDTAEVITSMDCDYSTIIETIENIICDPSDAKLPPSWRWLPDCDVYTLFYTIFYTLLQTSMVLILFLLN